MLQEIEEIIAMKDPVLRNLRITLAYHDLEVALDDVLGEQNVRWCAYATWASKTAGRFVRREEVPALLRSCLDRVAPHLRRAEQVDDELSCLHAGARLGPSCVLEPIERIVQEITTSVGEGNLDVFQELAPLYAGWIEAHRGGAAPDRAALDRCLGRLRSGPVEQGGQDLLLRAFTHYSDAILEPDLKRRAERILLANSQIGYHEQVRLQGSILGALNAPLSQYIVEGACERVHQATPAVLHRALDAILERALRPIAGAIEKEWRAIATRWLLQLHLPGTRVDLGVDVPSLPSGAMFPEELREIHEPELCELLRGLDRTANTLRGSGAHDWSEIGDRMNLIVDLFRSRQQDRRLLHAPFSSAQIASLRAGAVPSGPL